MSICRFVVLSITSLRCIQAFSIPTLCILAEIWWCRKDRLMFSFASEPKTTKRWCLNPSCCWFQSQPLSLQQRLFPRDITWQLCSYAILKHMKHLLIFCRLRWHTVRMSEISWSRPTHTLDTSRRQESYHQLLFLVTSVTWPTLEACDLKHQFWGWSN